MTTSCVPSKNIKGVFVNMAPAASLQDMLNSFRYHLCDRTGGCEIRSQVNDGPFKISPAGESFSESPGDRHGVSANHSKTDPAKTTCGLHRQ